ncbi:MAG: M48 family metallopeptidase [Planctomycetes bacterium]|jgi:predicted Zn-dependent protease|nr:M48 family metallopeptidase [Planctomycetota bacterium]
MKTKRTRRASLMMAGAVVVGSLWWAGAGWARPEGLSGLGDLLSRKNKGLSEDRWKSILRGAQAVQKTWQDLTPEQEYYIGRAVAAQVFQTYRPLDQAGANAYLNLLGQALAVFSARPETFGGYHFLLLDSDEINAFAAPGGLILVTRGMVRCCENEDELAAVVAHEICHVEKKHGLSAIKQGRLTEAFTIIAAESAKQTGNDQLAALTREFEGSVGDVVKTLTTSGYSQGQEREADTAAVRLLRRAGYPEQAMITMLQRMDERLTHARGLGFAKTHPSARSRANALLKTIEDTRSKANPVRAKRFSAAMQPVVASR